MYKIVGASTKKLLTVSQSGFHLRNNAIYTVSLFVLPFDATTNAIRRILYTKSVRKSLKAYLAPHSRRRRVARIQTGRSLKTNNIFVDAWPYSNSVASDKPVSPALW